MTTIFIGGSREVTRLPRDVQPRIDEIIRKDHHVILGDANGADKAVQEYLANQQFKNVTVFCSGDAPRNNMGRWQIHPVPADSKAKGYEFFAAKDREMARRAEFGFMIWDGQSPGTFLNVVRLLHEGKIAVLYNSPQRKAINLKTADQLRNFYCECPQSVRKNIEKRATRTEISFLSN
jgi:hypothetical protein